jgi:hypothetical protein
MAGPPVPQLLHLVLDVVRDVDQDVGRPPRRRCHQPVPQNGLQEGHDLLLCSRRVIRSLIDLIGQRHQHAPAVVSRLVRVVVVSGAIRSRCASMEATNDSHSSVSGMQMNGTQSTCLSAIIFDFSDDFKEI